MADEVSLEKVTNYLLKHFTEYCELEARVRELEDMVNTLWGELVNRTGEMDIKGDWYGLNKRLLMLEEGEEGRNNYLSNTLKQKSIPMQKKEYIKPQPQGYTGLKEEDNEQ